MQVMKRATPFEDMQLKFVREAGYGDLTLDKLRMNQVRAIRSALDRALTEFRSGDHFTAHAFVELAAELDRR